MTGEQDTDSQDPDTGAESPTIAASDVRVTLGDQRVLKGVSIAVDAGELVGLIGPNGAGKTTLLRVLNGTHTPDAGQVRVEGTALDALSARETARRVATVPQATTFSFEFTVREAVEMGRTPYVSRFGRLSDADRSAVTRAMEQTQVAAFADRSVTSLSGGERQRVLLARALAQGAPALLLDEPTASLDINHQIRTFRLVREAVTDGKAVLAAIHDLNLAARFCDRLVLLAEGTIRASGAPETVLGSEALETAFGIPTTLDRNPTTDDALVTPLKADADGGRPRDR